MKLYLARHGEANSDHSEPQLTANGRAHIERLAKTLHDHQVSVSHIYHSSKKRTLQTAEILAKFMEPKPIVTQLSGLNPNDLPSALLPTINEWQEPTLLVGHLPWIVHLTSLLLTDYEVGLTLEFTPGTIVCLHKTGLQWSLAWMLSEAIV